MFKTGEAVRSKFKNRYIGSFDTPEQASAAYMYLFLKKDLAGAKLSTLSADEVDAAFVAAKKIALGGGPGRCQWKMKKKRSQVR